ncbi:MAG TPA: hypothetical protein VHW60_22940, partial [Caulobacteraceae bacterium]|nr:hypothetical protein [Caulobacteraceae bacterium]
TALRAAAPRPPKAVLDAASRLEKLASMRSTDFSRSRQTVAHELARRRLVVSVRRQLLLAGVGATLFGAVVSGLLTTAWVGENLSGDFANQETGALDIGFTAAIFLTCTALIAAPVALIAIAGVLARALAMRPEPREPDARHH